MKKINPLLILLACLLCCTACTKSPSIAPAAEQNCAEFNALIKMAIDEDLLNLSPEAFIEKYKDLLSVTDDKTTVIGPSANMRIINFKAVKEGWFDQALTQYHNSDSADPTKMVLLHSQFSIKSNCAANAKELDALLTPLKPTDRIFSPEIGKENFWEFNYVDPIYATMRRHTAFYFQSSTASLIIGRSDYTPGGDSEGEDQSESEGGAQSEGDSEGDSEGEAQSESPGESQG